MEIENEANIYAAQMAIEYLQEQNTYDLRDLGEERFRTLIELITRNYNDKYVELDLDCPY